METLPETLLEGINTGYLHDDYEFFPLTGLQVGKWLSAFHSEGQLFMYHIKPNTLIFLSVHSETCPNLSSSYFLTYTRKELLKMCKNSPFTAPVNKKDSKIVNGSLLRRLNAEYGGVVAFEIDLKNLEGLDYSNTLNSYGSRLTLEVKKAKKLWFSSAIEFCKHYNITQSEINTDYYTPILSADQSTFATKQLCPKNEGFLPESSPFDLKEDLDFPQVNLNEIGSCTPEGRKLKARTRRSLSVVPVEDIMKILNENPYESNLHICEYNHFTIVAYFEEPIFPFFMKNLLKKPVNKYLLTMYERGIPSWAQFLPSYGLPYRPWMRRVMAVVIFLFSLITMLLGFYDLYKNIPQLRQFFSSIMGNFFETFEEAIVLRFSVLLGYIIASSQYFHNFVSKFLFFVPAFKSFLMQISSEFNTISFGIYEILTGIVNLGHAFVQMNKNLANGILEMIYMIFTGLYIKETLNIVVIGSLNILTNLVSVVVTLIKVSKDIANLMLKAPFQIIFKYVFLFFDETFELFTDIFVFFASILKTLKYMTTIFKSNTDGISVVESLSVFETMKQFWYDTFRHILRGITSIYHFTVNTTCNIYKHKDSMLVSLEIYYRYYCLILRAKIKTVRFWITLYVTTLVFLLILFD